MSLVVPSVQRAENVNGPVDREAENCGFRDMSSFVISGRLAFLNRSGGLSEMAACAAVLTIISPTSNLPRF